MIWHKFEKEKQNETCKQCIKQIKKKYNRMPNAYIQFDNFSNFKGYKL